VEAEMNFLYLYPDYEKAREAFYKKVDDLAGQLQGVFIGDLTITTVSDKHIFRYVPIRVSIDLDRLGFQSSVVYAQPLIEELCSQVKNELVFLNNYVVKAQALEYELREFNRRGSASGLCVQTPDDAPAGGTGDASSLELGAKITSRPPLLQGRFDF
jgi:hypothetical protein